VVFDFQDLDNPRQHMIYNGPTAAIDHNGYVKGDLFYLANYRAGIRVIDISNIGNRRMTEVGFFDTYPSSNGAAFNAVWNVYPYFSSGNIVLSDIEGGFFLVRKSSPNTCTATTPSSLTASSVTQSSAVLGWSAVSGTTYDLRYRAVGTNAWTTNAVSGTSTTISGLSAGTQYEAQVRSKCTGGSNSQYSSSTRFTTSAGTPPPGNCTSSFPFTESFESNLGAWTNATSGDDINWTRDSGGTPSRSTGPSTGAQGSFYVYVEASGNGTGFPNKSAILNSPCLDFSSLSSPSLSFQYHMFGSAINSLTVEARSGSGSWASIFSRTGAQGNQWNAADVDLSAYAGGASVEVRLGSGNPDPDPTPTCDSINFNDFTITSFSNQDAAGDFSVGNAGGSLSLTNNTWKYIALDYTVTANTVIEFEFSSTSQGEIHGIGFENDNSLTRDRYFKVHGTQDYGVTNYDNYAGGTTTYVVPVGAFYTGAMDRLVFMQCDYIQTLRHRS